MPTADARRGAVLAVVAALFAAGFLITFQAATRQAPRDTAVLVMLAWSALFNALFAAGRGRRHWRFDRAWLEAVIALAVMTVIGNIGVAGALGRLDAGLTSTIMQTQIFFVGVGGWLFLRERVDSRFAVGATLAMAGFALMGLPGARGTIAPGGILFAIMAAVGFAAMLVYTRAVIANIDPVSVNAARLVLASVALLCIPGQTDALTEIDGEVWLLTAIAAAVGPLASRLCLMYALRHITAARTKLISLLAPLFAFALAFAVYGTVPTSLELAAGALILAGVLVPVIRRG